MDLQSPQSPTLAVIRNRISKCEAQLDSLDERDVGYAVKKMVTEHGLASLHTQLATQQREQDHAEPEESTNVRQENAMDSSPATVIRRQPQSSFSTPKRSTGFAPYAGSSHSSFGGHGGSDSPLAGRGPASAAPTWTFRSPNDAPMLADTSGYLMEDERPSSTSVSSPESGFLVPSRKRQRETLDLTNSSPGHANKSLRATPSPAMTNATTPTSDDNFEIPEDLFGLLGGDPKVALREMRNEQRAHEKAMAAKREQEEMDAVLARSLQEEDATDLPAEMASAGPSTFPRSTSQTYLNSQGQFSRPDLQSPSQSALREPYFPQPSLSVKQDRSDPNDTSRSPTKKESSYQQRPSQITADDFINLESDDDSDYTHFNAGLGQYPNSDPVEIDQPSWWRDNNRQDQIRPPSPPPIRRHGAMNGPANHMNWGYGTGQLGQSLTTAAKGLYNGAYGLVDQTIASFGTNTPGYGGHSVYGSNVATSSSGLDVINLEEDYPPAQSLARRAFDRFGINANDPVNRRLVESYMDRVDYISHHPTRTAEEIKSLLENIRPDEDLPPENREGTPAAMTYPLMEHQKLGLAWMKRMEEGSNKGGILADDMGLGKTIQALALMVSRKSDNPACKTNLVVAPVALMKQWEREIQKKLKPGPQHRLSTFILHGSNRHATWEKLRTFDVVLTTFGTLATEVKRREGIEMAKRTNPNWRPTAKMHNLPLMGDDCMWYRVFVDEAQCIKNKGTKAAVGACLLKAKSRFCMTGTPMMNSVSELYSLIRFLRIGPYNEVENFRRAIERPLKGVSDAARSRAMKQLQALLKSILLRRTKKSQIDGRPILDLPERTTEVRHAVFSEDEEAFYKALETRTQLQFNKYLKAGTVGRNYSNILVLLLRLRQACCHPHLIKDFGQAGGPADISPEDMEGIARELAPEVVARIIEQSTSNDEKALECPICMDMTENATIFVPCGHNTCSECFARISDPSQAIADGDVNEGRGGDVKCPNCRAKVTPSRVIDHASFKKVHMPELAVNNVSEEVLEADGKSTDGSDSEDESDDDDDDETNSNGDLRDFVIPDGSASEHGEDSEDVKPPREHFERKSSSKKAKRSKGKGKAKETKPPKKSLAQLKKEGMKNIKAHKRYLKRLDKDWQTSGKIEKTMGILRDIQDRTDGKTHDGEKTIIFSQFTSLLDLLEVPISREGWNYRRYDGSMSSTARNDAVLDFTDKKECKIMLVSLKAGNAGLNLVAASQVIIFDPFWNPYIEEQAIDRAHRIGQMKPVRVHRILVPNTVEDRILALQEKKRELIESALDEGASKTIGRLGTRELAFLFVSGFMSLTDAAPTDNL